MKSVKKYFICVFFLLIFFVSCEKNPSEILVSAVTLDKTSVDLPVGKSLLLSASVFPDNATNKAIVWSSSDNSVVAVEDGLVTALKMGEAKVKAVCGEKFAICVVKVKPIEVESLTLDETNVNLRCGQTTTLTATVAPSDATDKTIIWSSSNPSVATVEGGVVKALMVGSATITAKAGDRITTCAVTVEATPVMSITLDRATASLKVGQSVTLTATVNPSDATDKTVTWTASNPSVAAVENGIVKAVKIGSATITAKAGDKTATCAVTVEATPVTSITLDRTTASLKVGQSVTLTATVNPSDATDKTVTWTASNPSVAAVENGIVKAVKIGSATITAKAGDKTATCAVTVEATPVTSITLDRTTASLKVGQSVTLTATVNPSDATDKTVTWTASNPSVAAVENGIVKAVKIGSATITAKAGDKTSTCIIHVVPSASGGHEGTIEEDW